MSNNNELEEGHILGPLTVNSFGEQFLFNLNRHSFDKVSASSLFERKFSKTLFNENTLNIVVGTDSGLLPSYVLNKAVPKGSRFIFIEPESVISALQESSLLPEQNDRVRCISLPQLGEALREFKVTDYFYINAVRSSNAFCAQDDFINEYAELSWSLVEILTQLNWESNVSIGQEAFIDRQIKNVADNRLPAKLLKNAFEGQTVALLAGGPSLDEVLPWIKEHRDELVVFAVSRISKQLLAAEVMPDFVFSVDPQDISFDVSKEMLLFGSRTVFVCSYHAAPGLINQWHGPMLYLGQRFPWESSLNEPNLNGAGPTVTNSALSVAYDFGFSRVIFAGVDLCFTRDGFTHAKGSNEQLSGPRLNLTSLQVETNGGFMAPTGNDYAQAIKTLSLQARQFVAAGRKVISCAPGAAKIEGVSYLPLDELSIDNKAVNAWAIVQDKLIHRIDEMEYLDKLQAELRRAEYQISSIGRLAKQARSINDGMYSEAGVLENYKDKRELDRIEKKFKREHRHFAKFVKRFGIRRFIQVIKPFTDEDWTFEEARVLGNLFYDAYIEGSEKLKHLLEGAIQRVEARQQERQLEPDYGRMFQQWRNDKSYRRAMFWRERHPDIKLSNELNEVFAEFNQLFDDVLHQQDTGHLARVKARSNLSIVRQRAGLLFKHRKVEQLSDLLKSLEKHPEQQSIEPFKSLIEGYMAELEGESGRALLAYQAIIDIGDKLLEEALIRVASISIEREESHSVLLALQCLSQLNPVYLPYYADAQRLNGDPMAAIDIFGAYLQQFPADVLVQLKLAMLYIDCKIFEGADIMLNFILQQRPDYEPAIAVKKHLLECQLPVN